MTSYSAAKSAPIRKFLLHALNRRNVVAGLRSTLGSVESFVAYHYLDH
jgi:hypothetical protein